MLGFLANGIRLRAFSFLLALCTLSACGQGLRPDSLDSDGLPVNETWETRGPDESAFEPAPPPPVEIKPSPWGDTVMRVGPGDPGSEGLPAFNEVWGLKRSVYNKAVSFRKSRIVEFANPRFVALVDMSQHSSRARFFPFDLESGELERRVVAHGKGSDPENTGYATLFSNRTGSRQTSLGAYKTLGTYTGQHRESLRLAGWEETNSRALERAVVVHGSRYVSNEDQRAGRSWGCPALDDKVVASVISRLKGGAMLVVWN